MLKKHQEYTNLFNREQVSCWEGCVSIIERKKGGQGTITFNHSGLGVVITPPGGGKHIFPILKNQKGADGALLLSKDGKMHLYLIELKSNLSLKDWAKSIEQCKSMFLCSLAVMGVLKISITQIESVTCCIAYKNDKMAQNTTDPIYLKTFVGVKPQLTPLQAWQKKKITLDHAKISNVVTIERDESGNASFDIL